jgi:hypothetical protein
LLKRGTELHIVGGPVAASGYWWFEVQPRNGVLRDGIAEGWVAASDHDGTAWMNAKTGGH